MWNAVKGFFSFLSRVLAVLGRAIIVPLGAIGRLYLRLGTIAKIIVGIAALWLIGLYGYFFWQTQAWTNFNPDYPAAYNYQSATTPGEELAQSNQAPSTPAVTDPAAPAAATDPTVASTARKCSPSAIATVAADLTDFNVNQNAWISSMLLYKLGFFGLDWDRTPFLDNKASFQRGINAGVRRTAIELVDNIGRLRGTSQIDADLQKARGNLQFAEDSWYFGLSPFGPKTPTPSYYRSAIKDLRSFNTRLSNCQATFDARADNLIQFVDRIASDLGSTSAILKDRAENYHAGWFDTRADDRFWFAYGQLYAYYGLLRAAHSDFRNVLAEKHLDGVWDEMEKQLRTALDMQPAIVSNGSQDAWFTPSHLTTMGFYILRVRSNLVDIKQVLER